MPHQCTSCARQFADGSKEMLSGCPDCGGTKFQFMPNGGAPAAEEPPSPPERGTGTVTETVGHVATKLRDFVGDDPSPPKGRPSEGPAGGTSSGEAGGTTGNTGSGSTGSAGSGSTAAAAATQVETESGTSSDRDGVARDGSTVEASSERVADSDGSESVDASTDALDDRRTTDPPTDQSTDGSDTNTTGADGSIEGAPGPEDGAQSAARSQMVTADELPDGPAWPGTEDDGDVQPASDPDAESEGRVVDTPSTDAPDLAQLREELNDQFEGIRITEPGQYELNLMELYEREETIIALQENGRYVIEPPESWRGDDE